MTKKEIAEKIIADVINMHIRENYINHTLSNIYTRWFLDKDGNVYTKTSAKYIDAKPDNKSDEELYYIRPSDVEKLISIDGILKNQISVSKAEAMTDIEFLNIAYGYCYDIGKAFDHNFDKKYLCDEYNFAKMIELELENIGIE